MQIADCANIINLDQPTKDLVKSRHATLTTLTPDTRQVRPGACFVAITGRHFDGHQHVKEAIAAVRSWSSSNTRFLPLAR